MTAIFAVVLNSVILFNYIPSQLNREMHSEKRNLRLWIQQRLRLSWLLCLFCGIQFCNFELSFASETEVVAQTSILKSKPAIIWGVNSGPPFHILTGSYKQQGICDVLIEAIHRQLPRYRKKIVQMPQSRISEALKQREQLCFACMIHPMAPSDRARFSLPTHTYRPHQLITTPQIAERIKQHYAIPVPLEQLLADPDFRFGYPKGRKFGRLQPLIEQAEKVNQLFSRSGDEGIAAILEMIAEGKLDYTLDYAMAMHYAELINNDRKFVTLPIAENHQQVVLGGIGCGDNETNQQVLADINHQILQIRQDPQLLRVLKLWQEFNDPSYFEFNQHHLQQADKTLSKQTQPSTGSVGVVKVN